MKKVLFFSVLIAYVFALLGCGAAGQPGASGGVISGAPPSLPANSKELEGPSETPAQESGRGVVFGKGASLRALPSDDAEVVQSLPAGAILTVDESGGWCFASRAGESGYVKAEYVLSGLEIDAAGAAVDEDISALPQTLEAPLLIVDKGARRLLLYDAGRHVATFQIALGFSPEGEKQVEGDGKTPEGEYYLIRKNPYSTFYKSIGISYPSVKDAVWGLENGKISRAEYEAIVAAIEARQLPPWKTALGGEVCLHGKGGGRGDWTAGCVAMDDDRMDVIWTLCPEGTPISILP